MKRSLLLAHGSGLGLGVGDETDTDTLIENVIAQKAARENGVRSTLPLTPPAENTSMGVGELTVTLRPNAGNGEESLGLQVISSAELLGASDDVTVPCYVSYELLKSLLDEGDPLAAEIRALELRNGVML